MEKMRFGLAGYGKVAELHARAIVAAENSKLVSVCGRDKQKCEAFALRHGINARGSIGEMVAKDKVEAVLIVTPHPSHKLIAVEAAGAGCHVLVEKPMALSVADCEAMIDASAAAGKSLGVVSQRRWYPSVRRIRDAIDSGALGKPSIAQVTMLGWRDEAYYNADPWRGTWAMEGGGVLVNQAPHQLDLLAWFMGPAKEIAGVWDNVNHPYIEVEDTAIAAIRFANGGMGSVLVSNSQKPGIYAKVHIHGSSGASAGVQTDGGAMFIAGMSGILEPPYNDLWTIPGQESMLPVWRAEDEAFFSKIDPTWYFFALQIAEFSESARAGRPPAVTGEDGRETVTIFEGIYRSDRKKTRRVNKS
ncbi:MAG: Gfo/Idh/MocA family protein [Syntrophales bacterium]